MMHNLNCDRVPLNLDFNHVVTEMNRILMPNGFDTTPVVIPDFQAVKDYWNMHGKIQVWTGASDKTVFGDPRVNWAFRAWHDYVHLMNNLDFNHTDEAKVCTIQQAQARAWMEDNGYGEFRIQAVEDMLEAEINGQISHQRIHGDFPEDQLAFTKSYIRKSGGSVCGKF